MWHPSKLPFKTYSHRNIWIKRNDYAIDCQQQSEEWNDWSSLQICFLKIWHQVINVIRFIFVRCMMYDYPDKYNSNLECWLFWHQRNSTGHVLFVSFQDWHWLIMADLVLILVHTFIIAVQLNMLFVVYLLLLFDFLWHCTKHNHIEW